MSESKTINVRLMCGEIHSVSAVYVNNEPVEVLAVNDPPGTVTIAWDAEDEKPRPYSTIDSSWGYNDHRPTAHKSISDYQGQLEAKRKRRRRPE